MALVAKLPIVVELPAGGAGEIEPEGLRGGLMGGMGRLLESRRGVGEGVGGGAVVGEEISGITAMSTAFFSTRPRNAASAPFLSYVGTCEPSSLFPSSSVLFAVILARRPP